MRVILTDFVNFRWSNKQTDDNVIESIREVNERLNSCFGRIYYESDEVKQDVSLSEVSHVISNIEYDIETKRILGDFEILDTDKGKLLKSVLKYIDIPYMIFHIVSMGYEDSDIVTFKKIITWDLILKDIDVSSHRDETIDELLNNDEFDNSCVLSFMKTDNI